LEEVIDIDPNACWQRICDLLDTENQDSVDRQEIMELAGDLDEWLQKGGFEPNWAV
jgi:hypothetical protein